MLTSETGPVLTLVKNDGTPRLGGLFGYISPDCLPFVTKTG